MFVKINQATENKVKFMDDTTLATRGISDVLIMKRDGEHFLIKYVFYILEIKCNLLSIDPLLDKGYKIHMEGKVLRVMDANIILVFKAPMVTNRTFKIKLKVIEHSCLATTAS